MELSHWINEYFKLRRTSGIYENRRPEMPFTGGYRFCRGNILKYPLKIGYLLKFKEESSDDCDIVLC